MKKLFTTICVLSVASLVLFACKKKSTTTSSPSSTTTGTTTGALSINSTPQVNYTSGGTNYSYVAGSGSIESSSGTNKSLSSTSGVPSTDIFGASIDNGSSITYMNVNKGTLSFPYGQGKPDTAAFRTYFSTGSKSYSNNAANGIELSMYDATGTYWSTSLGAQTGSTFTIDASKQEYLLGTSGDQYMKIKASFACTLYTSTGTSKVITNGVFIGYFENM